MNKIKITSTGSTKSTYKENNQSPKHTTIKWDGEYDGNNAKINISVNGKKSKIKLSDDEIIDLLSSQVNSSPIDERLFNDLLAPVNQSPQIMSMPISVPMSNEIFSMSDNMPIIIKSNSMSPLNNTKKRHKHNKSKRTSGKGTRHKRTRHRRTKGKG
jgi:hypothetical protein